MTHLTPHRKQQFLLVLTDLLSALVVWVFFLLYRWVAYDNTAMSMQEMAIRIVHLYKPMLAYPFFCCVVYYLSGFYTRPFGKSIGRITFLTLFSAIIIALFTFFLIVIDDVVDSYRGVYSTPLLVLFVIQFLFTWMARIAVTFATGSHKHMPKTVSIKPDGTRPQLEPDTERVVILSDEKTDKEELYRLIGALYPTGVEIAYRAEVYDMVAGSARITDMYGEPLVDVTAPSMSDSQLCIKRAFDIAVSAVCLLLLSPVMAVIALAIRKESKGAVIYRQQRVGHFGRTFTIYKFRTMQQNAEQGLPQLASDDDPRITPLGRILRRYRLDELPQFWNVLKGDMSIVGPRPEREFFIQQIETVAPYYCLIYKMRPGLTSWGPIKVGYTDTLDKMVARLKYDLSYMDNMSLRLDLKIIARTFEVLIDGRGK